MTVSSAASWQPLWNNIFSSRSWGAYPAENLIRFIARNYYQVPDRSQVKILDLGAGSGANTLYLAREGFDTYAIDGSSVAIDIIAQRLEQENLQANLLVGDVGHIPLDDAYFDCIADINCIMCNTFDASKRILDRAADKLKPGGRIFSMCAKQGSWGEGMGTRIDEGTYEDAPDGPYANMGCVRFLRENQIDDLFSAYRDLEVNSYSFTRDNGTHELTFWLISGIKK